MTRSHAVALAALAVTVVAGGCLPFVAKECDEDRDCPGDSRCNLDEGFCYRIYPGDAAAADRTVAGDAARDAAARDHIADSGVDTGAEAQGFGTGADGLLRIVGQQMLGGALARISGEAGGRTLSAQLLVGTIAPGQRLLLHQSRSELGAYGHYEVVEVVEAFSNILVLATALHHSYVSRNDDDAQAVQVLQLSALEVPEGAVLVTRPWDARSGGVLALEVQGDAVIDGAVEAIGAGYQAPRGACGRACNHGYQGGSGRGSGSSSYGANGTGGGGGGGGTYNSGGGGGHALAGQKGGTDADKERTECSGDWGTGDGGAVAPLGSLGSVAHLGGAGGGGGLDSGGGLPGNGGNGGGLILIRARALTLGPAAHISADGVAGEDTDETSCGGSADGMGAGGGGAGGTVLIETRQAVDLGEAAVSARGGGGGVTAHPTKRGQILGGAGSVGRVGVRAPEVSGRSEPPHESF